MNRNLIAFSFHLSQCNHWKTDPKTPNNVLLCDRNGADTHLESALDCLHINNDGLRLDTDLADRTTEEVEQTNGGKARRTGNA